MKVDLADVDSDGDLDLVVANVGQNRLCLNDGTGTFTDVTGTRMPADNDDTYDVAIGDVDGDGDADLVLANWRSLRSRLYVNDGTGRFTDVTAARLPSMTDSATSAALADVDADGDLDLVLGNSRDVLSPSSGQTRLYTNDGSGTFTDVTAQRMPADSDNTLAVALGDVDGDGDIDIVLGNAVEQNRLYLNDGSGRFTDATAGRVPTRRDSTQALALGDVDSDGDADLVFGNHQDQNRLYMNDGAGRFTDVSGTRMPADDDQTSAVALGDVDGDGDVDLVLGNWMQRNKPCLNLLRQLDTPYLAVLGREYRMDFHARYGPPRLVDVVLPFVSSATARIALPPFGTVGIDPAFMIPLAPLVVPQPAGVGSLTEPIPNNASLVGLSLHGQALLLQWPSTALLTNVTSDQIVR